MVVSNTVSSWYDPVQGRAFTTSYINDVPDEFKLSLVQHTNATGTASTMYPKIPASISIASTSKTISFN
jgi:hypothetical protein